MRRTKFAMTFLAGLTVGALAVGLIVVRAEAVSAQQRLAKAEYVLLTAAATKAAQEPPQELRAETPPSASLASGNQPTEARQSGSVEPVVPNDPLPGSGVPPAAPATVSTPIPMAAPEANQLPPPSFGANPRIEDPAPAMPPPFNNVSPTASDSRNDPESRAESFVEKTREELQSRLKDLQSEKESLEARLAKIEKYSRLMKSLLGAFDDQEKAASPILPAPGSEPVLAPVSPPNLPQS